MQIPKIAFVKWIDASYQRGECSYDELNPSVVMWSAGLLIRDDDEFISIAIDSFADDETFRYIEHIPRVNIIELRTIEREAMKPEDQKEK